MIQIIIGLLGLLGLAIATLFGIKHKLYILDLINKNSKVIDEVKDLAVKQALNNNNLAIEEQKRADLNKDLNKIENSSDETQADLANFFNKENK